MSDLPEGRELSPTEEYLMRENQRLFKQNEQLRRACTNKDKEIKKLGRIINKKNRREKQHYRNIQRGSKHQGG